MSQDDSADVIGERGASAVIAAQHSDGTATLFFNRNGPEPEARPVYSVSLPSGDATPELRACTEGVPGCHDPCPSPDGRWLASVHSDDVTCASPHSYPSSSWQTAPEDALWPGRTRCPSTSSAPAPARASPRRVQSCRAAARLRAASWPRAILRAPRATGVSSSGSGCLCRRPTPATAPLSSGAPKPPSQGSA